MPNEEKRLWGIHTMDDKLFLRDNVIAIGWRDMGDLSKVDASREAFKARYIETNPDAKKGSVATCSGMLYRFCHEVQVGDYMFSDGSVDANGIKKIVAVFNNTNLSHGRHIDFDQCKEIGLRVRELDEDLPVHDFIMMVHDMYLLTMTKDKVASLIEGNNGKLFEA